MMAKTWHPGNRGPTTKEERFLALPATANKPSNLYYVKTCPWWGQHLFNCQKQAVSLPASKNADCAECVAFLSLQVIPLPFQESCQHFVLCVALDYTQACRTCLILFPYLSHGRLMRSLFLLVTRASNIPFLFFPGASQCLKCWPQKSCRLLLSTFSSNT